jgi:hypothetical protein
VLAFSFPDKWIVAYDLQLEKVPDHFIIYETYLDAAPVIEEDGTLWDKYCRYNNNDFEIYREKNILQYIREFNFSEERAYDLIGQNPSRNRGYEDEREYENRMW